jgi:hypothetical protein
MLKNRDYSFLQKPSVIFLLFCFCFSVVLMDLWRSWHFEEHTFKWDVANYYSFLPAYFNNHGSFEFNHEITSYLAQSPKGGHLPKATYGMSLMYSPFYFLGYKIAINQGNPLNGISEPFATCVHWGSILYGLIGLIFLRNLLVKFFSEKVTTLTLAVVFFGTTLFYYTLGAGEMSHAHLFFLITALFLIINSWHSKPTYFKSVLIGFLMAVITLIRPSEILLAVFFIFWTTDGQFNFKERMLFLLKKWPHVLTITIIAFLVWVPQFIFWKNHTGHYLYFSYPGEKFYWGDPQIINILFSYRKGWFLYTPLIVLAFAGFFFMKGNLKTLRNVIFIIIAINIYMLSCWWDWFFGGSFGARGFTHHTAFLAIPLGAFLSFILEGLKEYTWKPIVTFSLYAVLFLGICLNIGQTYQFVNNIIHYMSMTKKSYWHVLGRYKLYGKAEHDYWRSLKEPNYHKLFSGEDRDQ